VGRDRQGIESRNSAGSLFSNSQSFKASSQRQEALKANEHRSHHMNIQELFAEMETAPVVKRAITNHSTLNEAYDYGSAFSRGMRIDLNGVTILLISGTASIDEHGHTVHVGDFRAQLKRTFENITKLLAPEGATWHDIVRTTCYLRDIERDYQVFNDERTSFYKLQGLDPLPASTGIQAILCRPDLLIEIEAIAMFRRESPTE
jgi:enamine deaminase RidA (YjgF/YER057c/UK114 family)